jgi:hypothetical protein
VVCLGDCCGGGGAPTLPSTSPNARRRFVDFGAAARKAIRIAVLACSADFLVVAASFSCCFRFLFSSRSRAFASRSFFLTSAASFRASFALSACCFLYNLAASASLFVCFFIEFLRLFFLQLYYFALSRFNYLLRTLERRLATNFFRLLQL